MINLAPYTPTNAGMLSQAAWRVGNNSLSGYLGGKQHGGYFCEQLERIIEEKLKVRHAIVVNSATTGLLAACAVAGCVPGSMVHSTAYTMSGTAAPAGLLGAKFQWNDIEDKTFNMDGVISLKKGDIVIATSIFGHPANLHQLRNQSDLCGAIMIEDAAQSIMAMELGRYAGTVGHMGILSFNVHKHIHGGEGGAVLTNDDGFAYLLREFRNHGELSHGSFGLNLRMTEITAAIISEQFVKVENYVASRRELAEFFNECFKPYSDQVSIPHVRETCTHSYYVYALKFKDRKKITPLLRKHGIPIYDGYVNPLYNLPAFKSRTIVSTKCPVLERVDKELAFIEICGINPIQAQRIQIREVIDEVLGSNQNERKILPVREKDTSEGQGAI